MSRSKKKNPISGYTTAVSEKEDKRKANRALRRRVHSMNLRTEQTLPLLREVSDVWSMGKDGKTLVDPERFPEVLRK